MKSFILFVYDNICTKHVDVVLLRYHGDNCTKIALKSQPVYTCDFEVVTSARQKLY